MAHLLHIDSSPRDERSRSRKFSREFVEAWKQAHPNDSVTYRDIGRNSIPHLTETWITAAYTPSEQRTPELSAALCISDQLVDELLAADICVIGVPMYNYSIPSVLKAYIDEVNAAPGGNLQENVDQIVRIGRTFDFVPEQSENPYKPLVLGKKMFVITARGSSGYGLGERYETLNYQDPYLSAIFGLIGITDIDFIHVENEESGGTGLAESIANARAKIVELVPA